MKTHKIEILRRGRWNGLDYVLRDLQDIKRSFDDLELSGRVPVGIGHQRLDTEPAQAWIVGLSIVDDDVLVADVEIVRDELLDEIKLGKWRNVSVELMRDVERGGKKYRWVLFGLAILGAAPPAVVGLRPLTDLPAKTARALVEGATFAGIVMFSRQLPEDEATRLRAENAKLTARLIDQTFNTAIEAGKVLPRDREAFRKRFGAAATIEDALSWIAASPRPSQSASQSTRKSPPEQLAGAPDVQLVALTNEAMRNARREGDPITLDEAAVLVLKQNPELAKQWQTMMSDRSGHGQ